MMVGGRGSDLEGGMIDGVKVKVWKLAVIVVVWEVTIAAISSNSSSSGLTQGGDDGGDDMQARWKRGYCTPKRENYEFRQRREKREHNPSLVCC